MPSETHETSVELQPPARRWWLWLVLGLDAVLVVLALIGWWLLQPPTYSGERMVLVTPGQSVSEIVAAVAEAGVVRSENMLYLVTQLRFSEETIETGTYTFTSGQSTWEVAEQLLLTTPADELVSITFVEGTTVAAMAAVADAALTSITEADFIAQASSSEGLLWPETYFVPLDYTGEELVTLLRDTHDSVLAEYAEEIATHPLTQSEIVNLASILEREANDPTSKAAVAGILLNRLEAGMLLQADATIEYVLETPLNELPPGGLAENLREVDSPYNTYKNLGLPPTPIGNPGRNAIEAVLRPTESNNFFYLTAPDGSFYYAATYNEHLVNIDRYLR
jgi:UPF0755 protein